MSLQARAIIVSLSNAFLEKLDRIAFPLINSLFDLYFEKNQRRIMNKIENSIEKAVMYFENQDTITFDAAATFTVMINKSYEPMLERFDGKISNYFLEWNDPHLRLLDSKYDPSLPKCKAKKKWDVEKLYEVEKPIIKCLYADKLQLKEDYLNELQIIDDNGGYGTTHSLIGCEILKRFSSISIGLISPIIESAISKIYKAQRYCPAEDLFFERTVLLQWLGYSHLIRPSWIMRIIFSQAEDGGWCWNRSIWPQQTNQHSSCLALAALVQYREYLKTELGETSHAVPSVIGSAFSMDVN
jgi:hypothetical protein